MTPVLVDTNVLIDVIREDPVWGGWSTSTLAAVADTAPVLINPVVYSELAMGFDTVEMLDATLGGLVTREPLPYPAAWLAGRVYLGYRRQGGSRPSPLPDFYIGAHAAVAGYRLLTRDPRRYRTHFPRLALIAPDTAA